MVISSLPVGVYSDHGLFTSPLTAWSFVISPNLGVLSAFTPAENFSTELHRNLALMFIRFLLLW